MSTKHTPLVVVATALITLSGCLQNGGTKQTAELTDWTPFLQPMMSGCDYPDMQTPQPDMTETYPKHLDKSVKSILIKGDPNKKKEEISYTYDLNNAVAFGYTLEKIEYLRGYESSRLKLIFKENEFYDLRPHFKLPNKEKYNTLEKNNEEGYAVLDGDSSFLSFDKKERSITCGSGV